MHASNSSGKVDGPGRRDWPCQVRDCVPGSPPGRPVIVGPSPGTKGGVALRRHTAGFTITELLIAVAILFILMTGIMTTYVFSIWGFQSTANYVQLHQDGRTAVNQFLQDKDMRGVYSLVSFATNGPVVVQVATNFNSGTFMLNTVTYTFNSSGHTFSRQDRSGSTLLATNVNNAIFTIYDLNFNQTNNPNVAKSIQLDLTMSNSVVKWPETEDYLSARTVMRNTPF